MITNLKRNFITSGCANAVSFMQWPELAIHGRNRRYGYFETVTRLIQGTSSRSAGTISGRPELDWELYFGPTTEVRAAVCLSIVSRPGTDCECYVYVSNPLIIEAAGIKLSAKRLIEAKTKGRETAIHKGFSI